MRRGSHGLAYIPTPTRLLRAADAVVLDPNSLLDATPDDIGGAIRIQLSGSAQAEPDASVMLLWPAEDHAGRPVTVPWGHVTTETLVHGRPGLSSGVAILAGMCRESDGSGFMLGGLYYNGSTAWQRAHVNGASATASDLLRANVTRTKVDVPGFGNVVEGLGNTHRFTIGYSADRGAYYTTNPPTTSFTSQGSGLWHVLVIQPVALLGSTETVVVEVRGRAEDVDTHEWGSNTGTPILFIGDSNTAEALDGNRELSSFRYDLIERLKRRGIPAYPVGPEADSFSVRRPHAAVGGRTSADVLAVIDDILDTMPGPGIVPILLGTNDAAQGVLAAAFGSNMQSIVHAVHAHNVGHQILVSYPTPSRDSTDDTLQQTYHAQIDALTDVDAVVNPRTGFVVSTMLKTGDDVHWEDLGHLHVSAAVDAQITGGT